LDLYVTASPISAKAEGDDIVVRNPVAEPDDRFLAQARDSVAAARKYLADRYGLSSKKRYRFDFAVDSTGARFTGDSLGAAFAVGATVAVAQIEVFRERLSVAQAAAFSGALTPDGKLSRIDAEALKLKIYRAFHSDLKLLVIPRQHITGAWAYLSELETRSPGRKLEPVGAESLEDIVSDPRLVPPERFSTPAYFARRVWQAKRSTWVEIPAALALAAILFVLIAPASWMPWFSHNPHYATIDRLNNSMNVCNKDSFPLWPAVLPCTWSGPIGYDTLYVKIDDINGDGSNEVCCLLPSDQDCPDRTSLLCYSSTGTMLFKRPCSIPNEYPGDTAGVQYFAAQLSVVHDAHRVILVTAVAQNTPSRLHIRLWDEHGNPCGWYVNAGAGDLKLAYDFNRDGSQELFFETFNNRMGCVGLLVVGLDSLYGVGPPYKDPGWDLSWVRRGNQISYILFPVSDLGKACGELVSGYNLPITHGVRIDESGLIKVYTCESNVSTQAQLIYSVDRQYRVVKVEMTDQYRTRRQCLVESKILQEMDSEYSQRLADAVTYWTDSGWVTEGHLRAAGK
jgi:hypothetical protein